MFKWCWRKTYVDSKVEENLSYEQKLKQLGLECEEKTRQLRSKETLVTVFLKDGRRLTEKVRGHAILSGGFSFFGPPSLPFISSLTSEEAARNKAWEIMGNDLCGSGVFQVGDFVGRVEDVREVKIGPTYDVDPDQD